MVDIEPRRRPAGGGAALARREELTARAYELARGSRASSTWAAYTRQWARFEAWCVDAGETSLPAAPLTVARFLADLAPIWRPATAADPADTTMAGHVLQRPGLRPGTLAGYLAAISVAHTSAGQPNPASDESVRRVMAGLRRHPGLAPVTRRAAARRDQIAAICAAMNPDEHLADARDTALILIGWKAALRASDLAGMRLQDQRVTAEGLAVHLRRSKTDQNAAGATIGITSTGGDATAHPPGSGNRVSKSRDAHTAAGVGNRVSNATDPLSSSTDASITTPRDSPAVSLDAVGAWVRWRALLSSQGIVDGPAWRGIDRYGRRPREGGLTRDSIRLIVTRRAEAAGLDPDAWGAHSLRRGFATEAIARGVPERDVQRHGRWKSRTSMDSYIDEANTFDSTNPTRWLD